MTSKPWCDHAESAILLLEETDIAAVHSFFDAQNFSLLLSRVEERGIAISIELESGERSV